MRKGNRIGALLGAALLTTLGALAADIAPMPLVDTEGIPPFLPTITPVQRPALTPPAQVQAALPAGTILPESFSSRISLNGEWRFSGVQNAAAEFPADTDLGTGMESVAFNDAGWDRIAVPLDWYGKYPKTRKIDQPYTKAWYRKDLEIPQDWADKRVLLRFGVVGYEGLLFVNGQKIGEHHGDFTPWEADITAAVRPGQKNILSLRVFSDLGNHLSKAGPAKHTYGSQWGIENVKGGLWQDVELVARPAIYLQRVLVNSDLTANALQLDYVIRNESGKPASVTLQGAVAPAKATEASQSAGKAELATVNLTPGDNTGRCTFRLSAPHRWSVDDPYLYYLTLALVKDGKVADARLERFGFREFRIDGRYFALNGERIQLRGDNLPAVRYGGRGKSSQQDAEGLFAFLSGVKSLGVNMIRNAHQPVLPQALEIADELGVMIYDEWGWAFTDVIDEPEFEKRNLAEIQEWLHRDYNHASVVMWSMGNEVKHQKNEIIIRQMDKQVKLMRELDKQGRPVGSFSGVASFSSYGIEKMETDFLDLHDYFGLSTAPWTGWEDQLSREMRQAADIYGKDGKLEIPYIIWEYAGFSWGGRTDAKFRPDNLQDYLAYAKNVPTWATPAGIGFSGTLGLADTLKHGSRPGQERYGKRLTQLTRQNPEVAGYAPWFHGFDVPQAAGWNQPVLPGLRSANGDSLRNVFGGERYEQTLYVANDTTRTLNKTTALLSLATADGQEREIGRYDLGTIAAWQKFTKTISLTIPEMTGIAQLRVRLLEGEKEIGRNGFNLCVQTAKMLHEPLSVARKTGLYQAASAGAPVAAILKALGVGFSSVESCSQQTLDGLQAVIIPPLTLEQAQGFSEPERTALMSWVKAGGLVLQLEQNYAGKTPLQQQLTPAPNTFIDLVRADHPAFRNLQRQRFDGWENPNHGYAITFGAFPINSNVLAARGPMLGTTLLCNAVCEGVYGSGRIFSSQLLATSLWGKDAAASVYLRNVLAYLLSGNALAVAEPWTVEDGQVYVNESALVPLDLRGAVNVAFADEKADDGKGGWTDQGPDNDLSLMPVGRQNFCGVPLEIIDPATNNGKAAVVLRGQHRDYLPLQTPAIAVNKKFNRLFFLQSCAWGMKKERIADYRIQYADGTTQTIDLICKSNIDDWWGFGLLPDARQAMQLKTRTGQDVGLFLYAWENPFPQKEIAALTMTSADTGAIPILLAVSGELANEQPVVIDDGKSESKWSVLSTPENTNKPVVAFEKDGGPNGMGAVLVRMPAREPQAEPVAFKRFAPAGSTGCRYLCFQIKAETYGSLDVVLPPQDWKNPISARLPLDPKAGWIPVRLDLNTQMKLEKSGWTLDKLRGELFFYHKDESGAHQSLSFRITNIRLE